MDDVEGGAVSETEEAVAPVEVPVPLAAFARIVGPHVEPLRLIRQGGRLVAMQQATPGTDEEVWLKLLAIRHPNERHTPAGWRALIAKYGTEQAHPTHPDFGKVAK